LVRFSKKKKSRKSVLSILRVFCLSVFLSLAFGFDLFFDLGELFDLPFSWPFLARSAVLFLNQELFILLINKF
jgi:hypothetical protein